MLHEWRPKLAFRSILSLIAKKVPLVDHLKKECIVLLLPASDCKATAFGLLFGFPKATLGDRAILLRLRCILLQGADLIIFLFDEHTSRFFTRNKDEAALAQEIFNEKCHSLTLDQLIYRGVLEAE